MGLAVQDILKRVLLLRNKGRVRHNKWQGNNEK